MTTKRKANTGDTKDFVIPLDTPFVLGYACDTSAAMFEGMH